MRRIELADIILDSAHHRLISMLVVFAIQQERYISNFAVMETKHKTMSKNVAWICLSAFVASILGVNFAPVLLRAWRSSTEMPAWAYPATLLFFMGLALAFALTLPAAIRSLRSVRSDS